MEQHAAPSSSTAGAAATIPCDRVTRDDDATADTRRRQRRVCSAASYMGVVSAACEHAAAAASGCATATRGCLAAAASVRAATAECLGAAVSAACGRIAVNTCGQGSPAALGYVAARGRPATAHRCHAGDARWCQLVGGTAITATWGDSAIVLAISILFLTNPTANSLYLDNLAPNLHVKLVAEPEISSSQKVEAKVDIQDHNDHRNFG
ncbi:hypothetical protein ACP70R_044578 [Stipagrostis hirtigluma subsp. patula]